MTSPAFESFLARIYVDAEARERFLTDPRAEARRAALTGAEVEALVAIDRVGLRLLSEGLARRHERRGKTARSYRA